MWGWNKEDRVRFELIEKDLVLQNANLDVLKVQLEILTRDSNINQIHAEWSLELQEMTINVLKQLLEVQQKAHGIEAKELPRQIREFHLDMYAAKAGSASKDEYIAKLEEVKKVWSEKLAPNTVPPKEKAR